ncbi:hypothetical protein BC827DRAFT_1187091 [Russula dissimulans]|nr:hypothetical protein BC827DRAFT_1187091 [Russula dissimulans]
MKSLLVIRKISLWSVADADGLVRVLTAMTTAIRHHAASHFTSWRSHLHAPLFLFFFFFPNSYLTTSSLHPIIPLWSPPSMLGWASHNEWGACLCRPRTLGHRTSGDGDAMAMSARWLRCSAMAAVATVTPCTVAACADCLTISPSACMAARECDTPTREYLEIENYHVQ